MNFSHDPYPELIISKAALQNNLNLFKNRTGNKTKILIPVKANAYGCGIKEMLPFFETAAIDYLGVANPIEGHMLRELGWKGRILNLGGFYTEHAAYFFNYYITPSITDVWQIQLLENEAVKRNRSLPVQLKLDLGMGRIGLKTEHAGKLISGIKTSPHIKVEGIFTHFPNADKKDEHSTLQIISNFTALSADIIEKLQLNRNEVILHAANSYATVFYPESHFDMIRPGLMFYGYFQDEADLNLHRGEIPLSPALSIYAKPISVRSLKKGETISYGSTAVVEAEELNVGVIPLGYADGIPRALSNKIVFKDHQLMGRVTMDQIILANIGDQDQPVEILGPNTPPLETWAKHAGTVSYEILTGLGNRLRRTLGD